MSWQFYDSTHVNKTRRNHTCEFCGRVIPSGTANILHWKGMWEGEFQNSYACNWCEDNQKHLVDDWDNEILDFGECLREDIFFSELDALEDNTYYESEGDYFTFKSYETDKELLRIRCPISRETKEGLKQ